MDTNLVDRVITGDTVVMYHDVTALTCAQKCASTALCSFFTYSASKRQCVFCTLCGNTSLAAMPGYRLFTLASGEHDVLPVFLAYW